MAKLKCKHTLSNGGGGGGKKRSAVRKINFVTTWDPMFPDISGALRKCQYILEEDEECRNLLPRGSFRVSYRRGHKNLKKLLEPFKIALSAGVAVGVVQANFGVGWANCFKAFCNWKKWNLLGW